MLHSIWFEKETKENCFKELFVIEQLVLLACSNSEGLAERIFNAFMAVKVSD